MIITHPDKAVATLVKLKQMGVSITIDDFGTGYSSLSYLARLPIQAVKIDQRFVRGLEQNPSDEAITQAIIALSHRSGLRVIAEGVETAAQFEFPASTHGCEEAQGFLISHPLGEAELRAWWQMQDERESHRRPAGRHVAGRERTSDRASVQDPPAYRRRAARPDRRRRSAAIVCGVRRQQRFARLRRRKAPPAPRNSARRTPTG